MSMTGNSDPDTMGETVNPTGETTVDVTVTDTNPDTDTDTATETNTDPTDPTPVCGDGKTEGTEECDDGNQEDDDGCTSSCQITAVCGNEVVEAGEVCDDGNTEDGDECSADCQVSTPDQVCGNGEVEDPEVCDDGNTDNGDGCEADCTPTPAECGNGVEEGDEECDDGNDINGGPGDFCKNDCTPFIPANCAAPPNYIVCDEDLNLADKADKTNAHKAMGICNDTPANSVQITNFEFTAAGNSSWQVAKGFGSYLFDADMDPATPDTRLFSPREGDTFLMVSTGTISAPNGQGIVTEAGNSQVGQGDNGNADVPDSMPAPLSDEVGSNNGGGGTPFIGCDGVNDCSDTLFEQWNNIATGNPNDKLFFRFNTTVPGRDVRLHVRLRVLLLGVAGLGRHAVQRHVHRVADRPDAGRPERRPAGRRVHRQRHVRARPERPGRRPAADDHGARHLLPGPGLQRERAAAGRHRVPEQRVLELVHGQGRRAAGRRPQHRLLHHRHGRLDPGDDGDRRQLPLGLQGLHPERGRRLRHSAAVVIG
jgi:cysteine-rich repeat protein